MDRMPNVLKLTFLFILLDAVINYFLQTFYQPLPITSVVPLIVLHQILFNRRALAHLKQSHLILLIIGNAGYAMGVVTADDISPHRFLEAGSALCAWLIGYWWACHFRGSADNMWPILAVVFLHVAICTIAVADILPSVFPTYDQIWSLNGILVRRPSVTTDQNFQILYFLPGIGIFIFARRFKIFSVGLVTLLFSVYVLAALQTRSGILVLVGAIAAGLCIHTLSRGGRRLRVITFGVIGAIGTMVFFVYRYESVKYLIIRFTETDLETGYGRLHGFLYFFEKIWNPMWWLPRGNTEYVSMVGVAPHSNITAQLMDGGLPGLICWLMLVAWPSIALFLNQVRKRLVSAYASVAVIGFSSLIVQLSLNVPLLDQIWLWGGVSTGCWTMLQHSKRKRTRRQQKPVTTNTIMEENHI